MLGMLLAVGVSGGSHYPWPMSNSPIVSPDPSIPSFEDDYDADGFDGSDAITFDLRRTRFACRSLTLTDRAELNKKIQAGVTEVEFFRLVLQPDHFEAFMAIADNKARPMKAETVMKLRRYILRRLSSVDDPKASDS